MTVGEPQDPPPTFVTDILNRQARDYGRYPPIAGTVALRAAAAGWLKRRYELAEGAIDPETQILPLAGSREGLFYSLFATHDQKEGMTAFIEKRPPHFEHR